MVENCLIISKDVIRQNLAFKSAIFQLGSYLKPWKGRRAKAMEYFVLMSHIRKRDMNKHYDQRDIKYYEGALLEYGLIWIDTNKPNNNFYITQKGVEALTVFNAMYQKKYDSLIFKEKLHPIK